MCHWEKLWVSDCHQLFTPVFYKRYVDGFFLSFKLRAHAQSFLYYLNFKHSNIKFTMDPENNGRISFLDYSIFRNNNKSEPSVFRKSTFSGPSSLLALLVFVLFSL